MKKIKYIILFLCILTAFCPAASADSEGDLFFNANKEYADGNYSKAAELYEDILRSGVKGGNVYYNLGNAYFKLDKKGKALVNYERARKFLAFDEDLMANYDFLKSMLQSDVPEEIYTWYERAIISIRDMMPAAGWFFTCLILFLIMCVVLCVALFKPAIKKTSIIVLSLCGVCLVLGLLFFFQSYGAEKGTVYGIVITQKVEVRYSPSFSGAVAFEAVEGMKAQILRIDGDWSYIRLNKKNSGWVESAAIEAI